MLILIRKYNYIVKKSGKLEIKRNNCDSLFLNTTYWANPTLFQQHSCI